MEPQFLHNVLLRNPVGGGRERDEGYAGQQLLQLGQVEIFRPEVVAPVGDAVGLVDGHQPDGKFLQAPYEIALRGEVEKFQCAGFHFFKDGLLLRPSLGGVEVGGLDAVEAQRVDLVFHQRDERGDDQREPIEKEGRHLVAE